jgi:5-methyltetrahydropteroyltriglutamate--homocysteine methyltransferase
MNLLALRLAERFGCRQNDWTDRQAQQPRPGDIVYDGGAWHALQPAILRRPAISCCASRRSACDINYSNEAYCDLEPPCRQWVATLNPERSMKTSTDRILTTHAGSLPRPRTLIDVIIGREQGQPIDDAAFAAATAQAVDDAVAKQVAAGVDIVSDGEMSKPSYTTYIRHRVEGIAPDPRAAEKGRNIMIGRDLLAHPDFGGIRRNFSATPFPGCVGPLRYKDRSALDRDLAHLKASADKTKPTEVFMTAPSPGILTRFIINLHYPNEDAYVDALAEIMMIEYQAIVRAGFLLQIDCPDLGSCRNNQYRDLTDEQFRKIAERNIAALNAATEGLPADRLRLHICWGNYEGPHTHDLPLTKIIDIAFKGRPQAISIEAANPRHDHEWEDLKEIAIPHDKILIPGVIDSTTNFVEHPKLVAQRIGRYADIVGRERVIAGVDCGFGTAVRTDPMVVDSVVWAKLAALAEGAKIASERLWR